MAVLVGCAIAPQAVAAQQPTLPPIRPLGAVIATSTEPLLRIQSVRVLSDGRVLVHDAQARRVILLDSSLSHARIVIDTNGVAALRFRPPFATIMAMDGDSSLFLDIQSAKATVIDPSGRVARTVTLPPRLIDGFPGAGSEPRSAVDHAGRLIYRAQQPGNLLLTLQGFIGDTIVASPDSLALLRYDLRTKKTDTVAMVQPPRVWTAVTRQERSGRSRPAIDPIPVPGDDWALLGDGTIAIVRVHDYHIDWIHPDGSRTSTAKVNHDWQRISDSAKVAMMDSVRRANNAAAADARYPLDSARYDSLALVAAANPDAIRLPSGAPTQLGPRPTHLAFVAAANLPDYVPPFGSDGAFVDAEGKLWVRVDPAGTMLFRETYDVIGRDGVLVDRVRTLGGTNLIGFAPGVAIMQVRLGSGPQIMKVRIR